MMGVIPSNLGKVFFSSRITPTAASLLRHAHTNRLPFFSNRSYIVYIIMEPLLFGGAVSTNGVVLVLKISAST